MKNFAPLLALAGAILTACTDDTSKIGVGIMPKSDSISTSAKTFNLYTTTVQVDSVLANTSHSQIGSIIDPEMRVRTTCDFLAQFHMPDNFVLPKRDIIYTDENGNLADSCVVRMYFTEYYGDSLATMKMQVRELDKNRVMEEDAYYYTNLNPEDYVLKNGGVSKSLTYAVKDLTLSDEQNSGSKYYRSVAVKLPQTYANELVAHYYEHPEHFKNSYQFIHNVCPGFYFKSAGGVGAMITAQMMCMDLYFRYHSKTTQGTDTIIDGMQRMGATAEVIQNTRISNDYPNGVDIDSLNRQACTYVKTPAGLFTEAALPVSEVVAGEHYTDSINQAKIVLRRYNSQEQSAYNLPKSKYLLMVRKADMKSFFEQDKLADSKTSYLAEYNESNNVYQFSNIAVLMGLLRDERDKGAGVKKEETEAERNVKYAQWEAEHPDWNKVLIVPVTAEYATITTTLGSSKKLMRIQNNLGLSSTRIEGGKDNPIEMSVIYGRLSR